MSFSLLELWQKKVPRLIIQSSRCYPVEKLWYHWQIWGQYQSVAISVQRARKPSADAQ